MFQDITRYQLGIAFRSDRDLIGDCGIHILGDPRLAEIGITVAPRFQCRGYATEALRAIVGYLFGKLRKDRISASIDPRNIDSLDPTYAKAGLPPASSHDREPLV
jgi:RimJ/RimL family protein N-acetyltransferase